MIGASRYFAREEEVDESFIGLYNSNLLRKWINWMKAEYADQFISTQITFEKSKKPLKNFIGRYLRGALYAKNLFFVELKNAMKKGETKIIINTGMYLKKSIGHANSILIDNRSKTVSVFEPNGSGYEEYMGASNTIGNFLVTYLSKKGYGTYTLRPASITCPLLGPQAREHAAFRQRDPKSKGHGFCAIWSLMYTHYHMLNPEATHDQVMEAMMGTFTNQELEKRVLRYAQKIMQYVAGFINSPLGDDDPKQRCVRFVRYYDRNEDDVLGMSEPINQSEPVTRDNRERYVAECRDILGDGQEPEDDDLEIDPEDIPEEDFQFDSPDAARCIRSVANVKEMSNSVKFDKPNFNPVYLKSVLGANSPKAAALMAKIEDLDTADMDTHGKKFKHFIFSDFRQEGAKFLVGALLSHGYKSCFKSNDLKLKTRAEMAKTVGENVIFLLSSSVFEKTFTVGLKKSVLDTFNSRPDNIHGELARIIVLDSGFKEGIDLFDVKYVHIFEPPTTRANLRQTIGRATRFCGQSGLPFDPREGWRLSVFLYDVNFGLDVKSVYKISTGADIVRRYISSDHRVAEFEEELDNFCLEVSVDRDLNQFIHQHTIESQTPVEHPERTVDPMVDVTEIVADIQMIPIIPPLKITRASKCGDVRPTRGVPLSTAMFYILAYCLGYTKTRDSGKIDGRELRTYLCGLLQDTSFLKEFNKVINNPIDTIAKHQEILKAAFVKGGDFSRIRASIRNQMMKIIYQALEQGVIDEMEKIKLKHRARKQKNKFVIPDVPGMNPEEINEIPAPDPPEERMTHEGLSEYILENYSHCIWPKPKLENQCVFQASAPGPKIVKFTPTQEFIRTYFTPANPYKGMLIQHGVGCGKTCTAIATATSTFDREGYKIIWVTRTSLKSDLYKNMFDLVCNAHIKEMIEEGKTVPASREAQMKLLGKAWSIPPISYRQFSNLVEGKNELYNRLAKLNGDADPLRKTLIIIDEAHKLYGGDDMSETEKPNIEAFHESLMNSYRVSGKDSARVMLMTATPYTSDPMEFFSLVNLVREEQEQLPTKFDDFKSTYLDDEGRFTETGKKNLMDQLAGQISYLNRQNDVRQFAQVHMHHIMANQRQVTDKTLRDDMKRIDERLVIMEYQKKILDGMILIEKRKKYGRGAENIERKRVTISRIETELLDLENKIDMAYVELEHYSDLLLEVERGNLSEGYLEALNKRCFKKIEVEE